MNPYLIIGKDGAEPVLIVAGSEKSVHLNQRRVQTGCLSRSVFVFVFGGVQTGCASLSPHLPAHHL